MQNTFTRPLPVVFSPRMVARSGSFSPSAEKPAQVVADWKAVGLPVRLLDVEPATVDELALAHDRAYVEGVLNGRRPNGFGNASPEVAASLPYTTGSMLTAARLALREQIAVCAPCSGFHHAHWKGGGGYCTFNGLLVTALAVLREGSARRVLILDCDEHYGDGTDDIRKHLRLGPEVAHYTAGQHFGVPADVAPFFKQLAMTLEAHADVDLVLYQAGADPHVNDPLGGWLTTEELRLRDQLVFETVARHHLPLVWNLAGGYQRDPSGGIAPVLEIHRNTAVEHLRAFCSPTR